MTLLALLLGSFLPALGPLWRVNAQGEEAVRITAQVGFDGYCKENTWLPIHVEVQNTGQDLNATIRVSYKNNNNGTTAARTEIALPATSRKELFLYIHPQGYLRELNVGLLDAGRLLKQVDLSFTCLADQNLLFGVLADDPSTFDVLGEVRPLDGFARVAQLRLSDLPDRPLAWASLDALIVSNTDTGALTSEQKQALAVWLGNGGKLLVTGGIRWQGTVAGLQDFLPLDIDMTRTVSGLPELQAFVQDPDPLEAEAVLSVGRTRGAANILVEQDGVPFLIQKQMGFGTVYFLAADPALRPLSDWAGMQELYAYLLGARPPLPRWTDHSVYEYSANQALGAIAELGLPSVLYIFCLLGFYVLVIGPLNYFVVRRLKRRELAWFTIPAVVVVFSCVAYGMGLAYRGNTPILNRLALAQASDEAALAQVHAWVGIYSPVRTKYELEATDGFMPEPFGSGNASVQSNNDWLTVQKESSTVMPDVSVDIGEMKAVEFDGSLPALELAHNLTLAVGDRAPKLSGSIQNKSTFALKDAMVITPGNWLRLGDLAPGESQSVDISLALGPTGPQFYSLDALSILNFDYTDIQTRVEAARQYSFLETILTTDYRMNDGNWGIYLMAWVDQPVLPVGLRDRRFTTIDTMLYVHRLSPTVAFVSDTMTLPATLFAWESTSATATPYNATNIPAGGYILRFRPAVPVKSRSIRSLELTLLSNTLSGGLIVSAWDYQQKGWSQISRSAGVIEIPEVERFVGPDGEVRIRLVSNQSGWFEMQDSFVTMVVER